MENALNYAFLLVVSVQKRDEQTPQHINYLEKEREEEKNHQSDQHKFPYKYF